MGVCTFKGALIGNRVLEQTIPVVTLDQYYVNIGRNNMIGIVRSFTDAVVSMSNDLATFTDST